MTKLTDDSLMPWGKHKGTKMANVSADYLLWVFENNKCSPEVANYINENMDVIKKESSKK
jgi:uncharacterized protein (DUF3820 family)